MERDIKGRFKKKYNRKQELIECSCGCGNKLLRLDNSNRIRKFIHGHPTNFKGKHHTEKTKLKISKIRIKQHIIPSSAFKKNNVPWNKGLKGKYNLPSLSEKRRGEISEHIKKAWKNEKYRKIKTEQNKIARAKLIIPFKDSSIEVKIQNFLKQLGIEFFTHQYMKEIEHSYQCDILIPSMNLVIECDGDYWHKYPVGLDKDHIRTKELIEKGFKVLRLWEHEIVNMNLNGFQERLKGGIR